MAKSRLWLVYASALAVLALAAPPAFATDATIEQVHAAAASGQIDQALAMMAQVLKDHPKSARAHYIEAELLARDHRMGEARTELTNAETLAPGLPFAKPHAVAELRQQLAGGGAVGAAEVAAPVAVSRPSGISYGPLIVIGLLLFGLFALFRRRQQANYPAPIVGPGYGGQQGYGGQGGPWSGPQGGMMGGSMGMAAAGMGGGLLGSLASGAAMGAGLAAGEELVGHMFGGERERVVERDVAPSGYDGSVNQDMGGDDFGISDGGSWDDGGSSGGDGW